MTDLTSRIRDNFSFAGIARCDGREYKYFHCEEHKSVGSTYLVRKDERVSHYIGQHFKKAEACHE